MSREQSDFSLKQPHVRMNFDSVSSNENSTANFNKKIVNYDIKVETLRNAKQI